MLRTVFTAGAAAALAAAALTPSAGAASSAPTPAPPGQITIDVVQVNGSGCRPGTATVSVSPDNTAFTVTYSEYLAQVGKDAKATDFRKNCQLGLNVNVPQGYTYAIAKADYRGFASLADGASATQKASYYFQGMSQTSSRAHTMRGPAEGNWQVSDSVPVEALVFSPCGAKRNLNINTELLAQAGSSDTANSTSFLTMDSTDGSINTVYHFSWKTCPQRR
ncbi:DUF4360 domain-containing protein [Streptomyces sp. NBC_00091]|uniref:DUF4360 domain-containing protein n=1 Tax=Streptomyces sp. NBC_00091 TaxID=2975648 RepID=UPI0022583FA6|nr:DUF4360 domain-containing protein [Streptomyces sp. NBC_00091]MCX5380542.1 DUF4360 domain-containing protein [Streptomyces sp. NBC_00091]